VIRIRVPGVGFGLAIQVTTNGITQHRGVVDLGTQSIETVAGEVIPRAQVLRVCHNGSGVWVNPDEARAVVLLLSMIAGVPHRQLLEMAKAGTEPEEPQAPKRPQGGGSLLRSALPSRP
jgi:hypothetical protein